VLIRVSQVIGTSGAQAALSDSGKRTTHLTTRANDRTLDIR
jgi:hypothetical protein